jgi:hypothetical protein
MTVVMPHLLLLLCLSQYALLGVFVAAGIQTSSMMIAILPTNPMTLMLSSTVVMEGPFAANANTPLPPLILTLFSSQSMMRPSMV